MPWKIKKEPAADAPEFWHMGTSCSSNGLHLYRLTPPSTIWRSVCGRWSRVSTSGGWTTGAVHMNCKTCEKLLALEKAFLEGLYDARHGELRESNPHPKRSHLAKQWWAGWDSIPKPERCPTCAAPTVTIFDHVDKDCTHD